MYDRLDRPLNVATLESNHSLLDGSMSEFPDDTGNLTWGVFSDSMSDADGVYTYPVELLLISFSTPHKSRGITLHYYGDTGYTLRVTWYSDTAFTHIICSGLYDTSPGTGVIRESVNGYMSIKIEAVASAIPFRHVKVWGIEYGVIRVIFDNEINKCNILEEIDPTAESLSYNTLRTNIRTQSSFISPITSPDFDDMLMELQPIYVSRDGKPFGTFFMDTWEDVYQSGIEFNITADDAVSILDRYPHMGGIYDSEPVTQLLDHIFSYSFPTGIVTYVLDSVYQSSTVSGWIPIGTCALALQHICCALNATVNVGRGGDVYVYPRETDAKTESVVETNNIQPWADINDLKSYEPPFFIPTGEPNYTLLDGGLMEFPDGNELYGWVSQSQSDGNGEFETVPHVRVALGTSRNIRTLIINQGLYDREYIKEMRVTFYDKNNDVILSKEYEFEGNPGVIADSVNGVRGLLFEPLKMSAPYRYARIAAIDYGRSYFIPLDKQYRKGRDSPTTFISGVRVTSYRYTPNNEESRIFEGVLPLERTTIQFPDPMHSLTITGGIILDCGANYAVVQSDNLSGTVTLDGKRYTDNRRIHAIDAGLEAGRIDTTAEYEWYTLISPDIGDARARDLFDHVRLPIRLETEIVLDDTEVGYIAQVETRGFPFVGVVQSLDINLRANRARMVSVGNVVRSSI
jgi:hypothetical protein